MSCIWSRSCDITLPLYVTATIDGSDYLKVLLELSSLHMSHLHIPEWLGVYAVHTLPDLYRAAGWIRTRSPYEFCKGYVSERLYTFDCYCDSSLDIRRLCDIPGYFVSLTFAFLTLCLFMQDLWLGAT